MGNYEVHRNFVNICVVPGKFFHNFYKGQKYKLNAKFYTHHEKFNSIRYFYPFSFI